MRARSNTFPGAIAVERRWGCYGFWICHDESSYSEILTDIADIADICPLLSGPKPGGLRTDTDTPYKGCP
jgi:hypothetical protein